MKYWRPNKTNKNNNNNNKYYHYNFRALLDAVRENVPGIYKFCHLSYNKTSELIYSGHTIYSSEGPQQGDLRVRSSVILLHHPPIGAFVGQPTKIGVHGRRHTRWLRFTGGL